MFTRKTVLFSLVAVSVWLLFFTWFWLTGYMYKNGEVFAQSLGTWADGAAHLTYISAMRYQPGFPEFLPTYIGKAFVYPFVADYLSVLLVKIGFNVFQAYSLIGVLLSALVVISLWGFYLLLTKKMGVAVLSLYLFLLSGGLGFIYFLSDLQLQGIDIFTAIPKEYTRLDKEHIMWLNVVTGELIPQRSILLGILVGLFALFVMWQLHRERRVKTPVLLILGGVIGLLPIVHPHTLIALSPVMGWHFLLSLKKGNWGRWLLFLVPGGIIASTILWFHIFPTTDNSFFRWYPGWLAKSMEISWITFWFLNWGILPIVAAIGWWRMPTQLKEFLFPFLGVFVLANLFLFQPYDWDNSKIITWVLLILVIPVALELYELLRSNAWYKQTIAVLLFILMTFSGALDVVRQLQSVTQVGMYSPHDLHLAEWIKTNTPTDSIWLTSDLHIHPVPTLTGRQLVMGYRGWLWSYGINYAKREQDVETMFTLSGNYRELFETYGVDYVAIGPHELNQYQIPLIRFESEFENVYQTQNYRVYAVK